MAIKDQCEACKAFEMSKEYCSEKKQVPTFDATLCDKYQKGENAQESQANNSKPHSLRKESILGEDLGDISKSMKDICVISYVMIGTGVAIGLFMAIESPLLAIVYILISGVFIIPTKNLKKQSEIIKAVLSEEEGKIDELIACAKSFWRFFKVYMIICLVLVIFSVFFSIGLMT